MGYVCEMFLILFWILATSHKWAGILLLFLNAQHSSSIWEKKIIYFLKTDCVSTGMIYMLCTKRWSDIKYNKDIVSKMFYYSIYCTLLLSFGCKVKRKNQHMKQPVLGITESFPSTIFKHQLTILDQIHFCKHSDISGFTSIPRPLEFFLLYLIFHSVNGSRSSNF